MGLYLEDFCFAFESLLDVVETGLGCDGFDHAVSHIVENEVFGSEIHLKELSSASFGRKGEESIPSDLHADSLYSSPRGDSWCTT